MTIDPFRLEVAAIELGRDIADRKIFDQKPRFDILVRETLLAVIASRIRWELASEIVNALLAKLEIENADGEPNIRVGLKAISAASQRHRYPRRYRTFLDALFAHNGRVLAEVDAVVRSGASPMAIRRGLVRQVPGLGPKAASLLLRNIGLGRELAVLDVHILEFMRLIGLNKVACTVTTVRHYEVQEELFVGYADFRRVPADALDLAVWTVVRCMKERNSVEHRDTRFRGARLDFGRHIGGGGRASAIPAFC
jgi:N-glycosylase/DNA lyase